jgi:arylformamidase
MRIIDISVPIRTGMVVYDGDPPVRVIPRDNDGDSNAFRVSDLALSTHTGTHVDAPAHLIAGGADIDALPFEVLMGPAHVIDATAVEGDLTADVIASLAIPPEARRLLFKTSNGRLWDEDLFNARFVAVTEDSARALVERGIALVGIDYLSIAPVRDPVPAHRALLEAGVVVVEGLDLRAVDPGRYTLICLPLRIERGDGAPARAVLVEA